MNQSNLAPVVLFVYGRPIHTQRTIDALLQNPESKDTDLIVYSDGPKQHNDTEKVESVREIIKKTSGFKSIKLIERTENLGLAANIIDGVTKVCEEYGKVIVLEDDIETSPTFLEYMNNALCFYQNELCIISISGYSYPITIPDNYQYDFYFLRIPLCWGWATWSDRWKLFNKSNSVINKIQPEEITHINFNNTLDFYSQAMDNMSGKLNTWFIFWYLSSFINKKLSVFPIKSLVSNIGNDGTGENCGDDDRHLNPSYNVHIKLTAKKVIEDDEIIKSHEVLFKTFKLSFFQKVTKKLKKLAYGIIR
jgi:hypothetical protein